VARRRSTVHRDAEDARPRKHGPGTVPTVHSSSQRYPNRHSKTGVATEPDPGCPTAESHRPTTKTNTAVATATTAISEHAAAAAATAIRGTAADVQSAVISAAVATNVCSSPPVVSERPPHTSVTISTDQDSRTTPVLFARSERPNDPSCGNAEEDVGSADTASAGSCARDVPTGVEDLE
jgi:hypothetical protein